MLGESSIESIARRISSDQAARGSSMKSAFLQRNRLLRRTLSHRLLQCSIGLCICVRDVCIGM